jgi:hypothetical protein
MALTREQRQVRALVDGLTHEDAADIIQALRVAAPAIDALDASFPDPEARAMAERMRVLADHLRGVNQARDFLEGA